MQSHEIRELFELQNVLAQVVGSVDADIVTEPEVLAALLDWKREGQVDINLSVTDGPPSATVTPRGKGGKAKEIPDDPPEPEF